MPYNQDRADLVARFIENLTLTKGKWAGKPFELLPWEKDLVDQLFGTLRDDGTRQYRTAYVEIGKKNGKQLALTTPVPTPQGWSTMGELKPGDQVYDEKGHPCNVVAVSPVDETEQAYKIHFRHGPSIVAGERHLWQVQITSNGHGEELFTTGEMYQRQGQAGCENGRPIFRIPVAGTRSGPETNRSEERDPNTRSHFHHISRIEKTDRCEMRCIQVDSPSRLYLAGKAMVPTHNSELAAAIALYMLCADGESNAEVYVAACDRQQASIIYNTAVSFVEGNRTLSRTMQLMKATKRIVYPRTGSYFQVLSSDVKSKSGINASCVILDEIWTYPNADLAKMLTTGSGDAREQPLFLYLTTAGNKLHGYGWDMHCRAKDILTGKRVDSTFLPIIYGLEEDADVSDEANWFKANPSLGHTIQLERVREHYEQAKEDPVDFALFKQLRLNMWLKQDIKWMPMEKWDSCAFAVDAEELKGRECYAGLDLASTTDISAFVLVFPPEDETDKFRALPFFWIPEETLEDRVRRDKVPYDRWRDEGFIYTTEGNVTHYGFIEKTIEELGEVFNIREIAYDRWNATQMAQNLQDMGFEMVQFGQGFKDMSLPTKELMRLVLSKRIGHGGHPVLRWMADNIVVETDPAENLKVTKQKSTERVDGVVALIMGLARAMHYDRGEGNSVYDRRDMLIL